MYKNYIKRTLDIIFSIILLVLLSPVIIVTYFAVLIFLGYPVIFKQKRPGYKEKIFNVYKFRTMDNKIDEKGNLLSDSKRLNSFGKILRKTSLDEIPQLFNILKGDMSFIGPRPLLVEYLEYYDQEEKKRHDIRPGISGLAQVNGRNSITWKQKFKLDIQYLEKISFLLDIKILILTIKNIIGSKDINQNNRATVDKYNGNN